MELLKKDDRVVHHKYGEGIVICVDKVVDVYLIQFEEYKVHKNFVKCFKFNTTDIRSN